MTFALQALIKAASMELGSDACRNGDHRWESEGGRTCPMGADGCSQAVYRCATCGEQDYGDGDGPGATDCRAACGDSMMGWRNGPFDPLADEGGTP